MTWIHRLRKRTDPAARRLRRAARGSEPDLEALYEAHADKLYAFVYYRLGRDASLAEDAVQETFTRALDQIDRYDPDRGSIQTWLRTLSRNVVRDQLRAHHRGEDLAALWDRIDQSLAQIFDALDRTPLSDEVIVLAETRDLVNMTISNLPEHYRSILEKKYVDGQSLDELAAQLKLSPAATKSLLARARRAFRETFEALGRSLAEVH